MQYLLLIRRRTKKDGNVWTICQLLSRNKSKQTMRGEKREDNPSILRHLLRLKRGFLSCNELFMK